ncbi:MAG: T9SS type A sorting domain-containing protein [Candidatus Delongbacteria bacterium]|nr:T9SS type A sorting domain-containing protein [Candidatus Delongbacteria bacterium]
MSLKNIQNDIGTDSVYFIGATPTQGFSDKDLNGDFWRNIYNAGLKYQISNHDELGKEMVMFSTTQYTPQLVIIGQDSKLVFSHFGMIDEDSIRVEIRKALDGFGNLQQTRKLDNIFINGSRSVIDLNANFATVDLSNIVYEILSVTDNTIIDADLIDSQLILSRGSNTGMTNIKIKAANMSESVIDSFDVMRYPANANILDFESGNLYDHWFHEGDADWYLDSDTVFEGEGCARSGYIDAPGDGEVNYTLLKTTFESTLDDTVSFAYKISSQYESDGFEVLIDGIWVDFPDSRWSGEVDWSFAEYPVPAGKHTIEWDYFKWDYNYSGKDAAWIDIIRIPGIITGIEHVVIPTKTHLNGNYPNPFNNETVIKYQLNSSSKVKLFVFNINGEFVSELINEKQNSGQHQVIFNAENINSGVYFYRLEAGTEVQTGKMMFLK